MSFGDVHCTYIPLFDSVLNFIIFLTTTNFRLYEGIICQGYFEKRKWKSNYLNCNISLWNMVNLIYFTSLTECGPFNIFCLKFLYISFCVTAWKGIQNSKVKGHWFQIWNSCNVAKKLFNSMMRILILLLNFLSGIFNCI